MFVILVVGMMYIHQGRADSPITCTAPPAVRGTPAQITCHFDESIIQAQWKIIVRLYKEDRSFKEILFCYWLDPEQYECKEEAGYTYTDLKKPPLTLEVQSATEDHVGTFVCQTIPSDPFQFVPCNFTLIETLPELPTTATGSSTDESKGPKLQSSTEVLPDENGDDKGIFVVAVIVPLAVTVLVIVLVGFACRNRIRSKRWKITSSKLEDDTKVEDVEKCEMQSLIIQDNCLPTASFNQRHEEEDTQIRVLTSATQSQPDKENDKGDKTEPGLKNLLSATQPSEKELLAACKKGDATRIKDLVKKGVTVNCTDEEGDTPLHLTSMHIAVDIVKELLVGGASVNAKGRRGLTPLHIACYNAETTEASRHRSEGVVEANHKRTSAAEKESSIISKGGEDSSVRGVPNNRREDLVDALLEAGASVDAVADSGRTPLHLACLSGNYDVVKLLLIKNARVDTRDSSGCIPLHCASQNGNESIMKSLIIAKSDTEAQDDKNRTPLHWACEYSQNTSVKMLLKAGASARARDKENMTPVHVACQKESKEVVKTLLDHGAGTEDEDNNGRTPLHLACLKGSKNIVKLLLFKRANATSKDNEDVTPLHLACKEGNTSIVQNLLDVGTDTNARDRRGLTPLHLACQKGSKSIVQLLLSHGADIEDRDCQGQTAFLIACQAGNPEVMKFLADNLADTGARDDVGMTSLHLACQAGREQAVQMLLEGAADPEARDNEGRSSLHIVCQEGRSEALKILLVFGAQLEARDNQVMTPLHRACQTGRKQIVEVLISHGADITAKTSTLATPARFAEENGHGDIAEMLQKVSLERRRSVQSLQSTGETLTAGDQEH